MEITLIKSPGNLEEKVQMPWEKLSEKAAHILIAELYRADCITFRQARHLLNSQSWEKAAGILEHYGCELYYDRDDFEDDLRSLGSLLSESALFMKDKTEKHQ